MELREVFENVYKVERKLATKNLIPGSKVYDEELIIIDHKEYRTWNPYRSKLAAAIINGLKNLSIHPGSKVLYLGAATGTTPSHVSDIIGENGTIFCVEFSERNMRELIQVCEKRPNMFPFLSDARITGNYSEDVEFADILYQDVSARDQAEILMNNGKLLKDGGIAYVAIKSQSISSSTKPEIVFREFLAKVSKDFDVLQEIDIEPFDKGHLFVVLRKR